MRDDDVEQAASAAECTGAVPALTDATGEADCRRLCDVMPARRRRERRGKR